jgi:hypothetical protein
MRRTLLLVRLFIYRYRIILLTEERIMELKDWIQLILAFWGAILSTILGILKIIENNRKIKIFLNYYSHIEQVQMIIVNTGHRPVTIVELGVRILIRPLNEPGAGAPIIRENSQNLNPQQLPITLGDGGSYCINLDDEIHPYLINFSEFQPEPFARDAEGREYTTKKIKLFNYRSSKVILERKL